MDELFVSVPKEEYFQLVEDASLLEALRQCGVHKWEGYYEARELLEGENDEN